MKNSFFAFFICFLCFCSFFSGCAPQPADWFAPFQNEFSADVTGTIHNLAFSATVEAEPVTPEGILPLTVTFYAPETLRGTVLKRDSAGQVNLLGETVRLESACGFDDLLQMFPTGGSVLAAELTGEGHTKLTLEGGSVEFLSNGTPIAVTCGSVAVSVIAFSAKNLKREIRAIF